MLRRALAESMKRVKLMATEETVDRRIVVKLLTTYFERGQSPEVLQLMTRMLGVSGATHVSKMMPLRTCEQFAEPRNWPCLKVNSTGPVARNGVGLLTLPALRA